MTNEERHNLLFRLCHISNLITNEYPNLEGDFYIRDEEKCKIFLVDEDEVMLYSGDQEHESLDKISFEDVSQSDIDRLDLILAKECMYASEWFKRSFLRWQQITNKQRT